MKQKPYLSRYEFEVQSLFKINSTMITESGEPSDDDEYHLETEGTFKTQALENSDYDEYVSSSTSKKRSLGDGDDDEYYISEIIEPSTKLQGSNILNNFIVQH